MFFYLAKILWFIVQPINLIIFLLLAGLAAGLLGRRRIMASAVILGGLILGASAWTSLGAFMMNPLEERFARPASLPDRIDGVVMLGGGLEGADQPGARRL